MLRLHSPFLLSALLSASLLGPCPDAGDGPVLELVPGSAMDGVHGVDEDPPVFRVAVPVTATSLRVRTEGASHDLLLFARFDAPPRPELGEWGVATPNSWVDEEILVDVTDGYALEEGDWYFRLPVASDALRADAVDEVSYRIHAELVEPRPVPLALGEAREVRLERSRGLRAAFRVELPEGAPSGPIRLEVHSPEADVDLLAGPDDPARVVLEAYDWSETNLNFERVVLDPEEIDDGLVLHAYVYPEYEGAEVVTARVLATDGAHGTPTLVPEPEVPSAVAADPLGRALAATVLVFGPTGSGSGVVVSPHGHCITNAHVVSGAGDDPTPSGLTTVGVGFTVDPRRAPTPTLGARLLDYREDLDLALLSIDVTLDGSPLPAETRFPWVELAAAEPALGAALTIAGYPDSGGTGSFVTITVTRGILSGFSREAEGLVYKTDAGIHAGVSGGACLDEAGRILGIPAATVGDANGSRLGYVIPVMLIPSEWRDLAGL